MMTSAAPSQQSTAGAHRPKLRRADGGASACSSLMTRKTLSDLLAMALRYEGWDVQTANDGMSAPGLLIETTQMLSSRRCSP